MRKFILSMTFLPLLLLCFTACETNSGKEDGDLVKEKDYIRLSTHPEVKSTFGFFYKESESYEGLYEYSIILIGGMTYQEYLVMMATESEIIPNDITMMEMALVVSDSKSIPTGEYVVTNVEEWVDRSEEHTS